MGREHHVRHRKQVGVDAGFTLKHVQPGGSNHPVFKCLCQRSVVHNAAARNVDQGGRGFHQGQFWRANAVVRGGAVGHHQDQMVRRRKQLLLAHITRLAFLLQRGAQGRAVVVDHLHAKAQSTPARNRLPNAAHAQYAQGAAVHFGAREHVVAPARPLARAQKVLALGHPPRRGHQQRKAKVRSGLGQHVWCVGAQDTRSRHGVKVKVVVAHGHVGADFQLWALR